MFSGTLEKLGRSNRHTGYLEQAMAENGEYYPRELVSDNTQMPLDLSRQQRAQLKELDRKHEAGIATPEDMLDGEHIVRGAWRAKEN